MDGIPSGAPGNIVGNTGATINTLSKGKIEGKTEGKIDTNTATWRSITFNISTIGLDLETVFIGASLKPVDTYKGIIKGFGWNESTVCIDYNTGDVYNRKTKRIHGLKLNSEQLNALNKFNERVIEEKKDTPLTRTSGKRVDELLKKQKNQGQPAVAFENPAKNKGDKDNALTRFKPNVKDAMRRRQRARDGIAF